jgi:hypothetical protein
LFSRVVWDIPRVWKLSFRNGDIEDRSCGSAWRRSVVSQDDSVSIRDLDIPQVVLDFHGNSDWFEARVGQRSEQGNANVTVEVLCASSNPSDSTDVSSGSRLNGKVKVVNIKSRQPGVEEASVFDTVWSGVGQGINLDWIIEGVVISRGSVPPKLHLSLVLDILEMSQTQRRYNKRE